jgi:uncharacterized protein YndB with AHSA1/START domain
MQQISVRRFHSANQGDSMQTQEARFTHKNSTPQSRLMVIERKFNVPVRNLFSAFKNPEAIKAWWWPKGLFTDQVNFDFREGGTYFINMKGNEEFGGGMTGQFEEIIENELIVMTDNFANANGQKISAKDAKMPGEWPETCYITFEFSPAGETMSRVVLSQEGIPNDQQEQCAVGWNQMFDKLTSYLTRQQ